MKREVVIEFDAVNAALGETPEEAQREAAFILRNAAKRIEFGQAGGPLHDSNGNLVGYFYTYLREAP